LVLNRPHEDGRGRPRAKMTMPWPRRVPKSRLFIDRPVRMWACPAAVGGGGGARVGSGGRGGTRSHHPARWGRSGTDLAHGHVGFPNHGYLWTALSGCGHVPRSARGGGMPVCWCHVGVRRGRCLHRRMVTAPRCASAGLLSRCTVPPLLLSGPTRTENGIWGPETPCFSFVIPSRRPRAAAEGGWVGPHEER